MKNSSPEALWDRILSKLEPEIGSDNLALWLKPVTATTMENGILRLRVPNRFFAEGIRDRFQTKIEAGLKALTGTAIALDFDVEKDLKPAPREPDPVE